MSKKKRIMVVSLIVFICLGAFFLKIAYNTKSWNQVKPSLASQLEEDGNKIKEVENVSDTNLMKNEYVKLEELPKNYNLKEAIEDGCFVDIHGEKYHKERYEEFMQQYQKKESAFLRFVAVTIEGDPIIYDIKYDSQKDKIIIKMDATRDKFSSIEDQTISQKEYEKIGIYQETFEGEEYVFWVAYSGELGEITAENVTSKHVFFITRIN